MIGQTPFRPARFSVCHRCEGLRHATGVLALDACDPGSARSTCSGDASVSNPSTSSRYAGSNLAWSSALPARTAAQAPLMIARIP